MPNPFSRLALAAAVALLPGSAFAATGYTLKAIALEGSPAPGTSDSFGGFLDVTLDEAGRCFAARCFGFPNGAPGGIGSGPCCARHGRKHRRKPGSYSLRRLHAGSQQVGAADSAPSRERRRAVTRHGRHRLGAGGPRRRARPARGSFAASSPESAS